MTPSRIPVRSTLAALMAGMLLAGAAHAQKAGGTLMIGPEAEFNGFNVGLNRAINTNTLLPMREVMEQLFVLDDKGQPIPELATSFQLAEDMQSAIIELNKNVTFHDGTPFNADAVIAHYTWLFNLKNGVNLSSIDRIASLEKVDEHTVKMLFKGPWATALSSIAMPGATSLIGSPTAIQKDPDGFHRKPVGTGPFVFKEWRSGDRVVLEKNPNYWQQGLPYLDQVIYKIIPDGNTRIKSLRSGELDITWVSTPQHVVEAQKDAKLVVNANDFGVAHVYNLNHSKPPFDDVRVRAAMIHAFNAPAVAQSYYLGTATPVDSVFPKSSPWYCPNLKDWRTYDLEKARALVKEVGKPIEFKITTISTPEWRRMAGIIQHMAKEAGMTAEIELVDQTENLRRGFSGDFQMNIWRFNPNGAEPGPTLQFYFGAVGNAQPFSRHDPSKVNGIIQSVLTEKDLEKRKEKYCEVNQIVSDEAMWLYGHHTPLFNVAHPHVKGVPADPLNGIRVKTVWLDK